MKQLTTGQKALLKLGKKLNDAQSTTKLFVNNRRADVFANQLKRYFGTIDYPDELPETFDDLIGLGNEKKILQDALNFLRNIETYQSNPILSPYTRFMLAGEPGSGKSDLIKALAKTAGVPLITFDMTTLVSFPAKIEQLLDLIFDFAKTLPNGSVILFNSFPAVTQLPPERSMFFHNNFIARVVQATSSIVIISTATESFAVPTFYFQDGAFSQTKIIQIMPPTVDVRRQLFESYCNKYQLTTTDDVSFRRLAQNTFGSYPKDIENIVRETAQHVARNGRLVVTAKDFNDIILNIEAGQLYYKLTEKGRRKTAYHESGHVIAAYYSDPEYSPGRVEITPRVHSLGLTEADAGEEMFGNFAHELECHIIYCLGGMAAERLIYGENTTGVGQDLQDATSVAIMMYQYLGMSDKLGPAVFDPNSGLSSSQFEYEYEKVISDKLKELFDITYKIVQTYKPQLEALTEALLKNEVLIGEEITNLLKEVDAQAGTPKRGTLDGIPKPPKVSETSVISE